jgi:hypothetical protein
MTQSPPPQPPEETARELLAVEQVDRDAAADFAGNYVPFTKEGMAALRSGTHDSHLFVQVFARHRLAALTHPISREAVARIIDPQAFAGPIFMDQAMRDDAAPARQASALAKADQIISPGGADESDLLLGQARFLLDRLNDFDDWSQDKDDLLRNWCGHVDPARSRLENTVAAMEAATPPSPSCLGVVEALEKLQKAEAEYRYQHDLHGDDSKESGRAWDLMRRAGDAARAQLVAASGGER